MRIVLFILLFTAALLTGCEPSSQPETLLVFAAASTVEAMTEVAEIFAEQTGVDVQVHSAASSTLARQIEAGVQAHVYVSANPQWMDYLVERDLVQVDTRQVLCANRLVLIQPNSTTPVGGNQELTEIMAGIRGRLAMGDPDHVPAGRYARQVLQSLDCDEKLKTQILPGSSVRVALAYVERGEAEWGIVYATDACKSDKVEVVTVFPEARHDPICFHGAATVHGSRTANDFVAFLMQGSAQDVFIRHNFLPVQEVH